MSTGVVIRLRNLPINAGTIDIRRFFGGLAIPDGGVHIIGGDDGTAFILFSTDEDARQAMLRDGQKLSADKVKLMLSSHTEMKLMIEESQRRYEVLRGLRPPEPPITNLTSRSSATGGNVKVEKSSEVSEESDCYIELRGMPYNSTEEDVVNFFSNIAVSALRIMKDDKGRSTGQAFVKFKSVAYKIEALKKDHDFMGPRFVRVQSATEQQWLLAGSQLCDTIRPGVDGYGNRKRPQANNTSSNEGTPKRSRALSPIRCDNCVELRGLPAIATNKMVDGIFFQLQIVEGGLFVEMDGKICKGRAFAEFANLKDYKDALLKDGEILDGKQIRVINISRQAMIEQIKQHKKYMKIKREEDYKREREDLKERQLQEKQRKLYEDQKRKDEDEQKKRREYQMKKQREMEEWLARQHVKEEEERKRFDIEKRILAQEKIQEEERMRKEAERQMVENERQRRDAEMRKKEEEKMRMDFERKRQMEMQRLEDIKKEDGRRMSEYKYDSDSNNVNGNAREMEMDLDEGDPSPPRSRDDRYPHPDNYGKPPSPYPPRSQYNSFRGSSGVVLAHSDSKPPPSQPFTSMPYQQRFTRPPPIPSAPIAMTPPPTVFKSITTSSLTLPSGATILAPPMPSTSMPPITLPGPRSVLSANQPPHLPPNLPPPPLPPAMTLTPVQVASNPLAIKVPLEVSSIYPPPHLKPVQLVPMIASPHIAAPRLPPPIPLPREPVFESKSVAPPSPSKFVRIANSPFETKEEQVIKFFNGLKIAPNGVQFVMRYKRKSGHIFIKFASGEDALKAAEKDKHTLGGREVLVQMSNVGQMTELLKKYDHRPFEILFPNEEKGHPHGGASVPDFDKNLEKAILHERLMCIRLSNVPREATIPDILKAFSGISIMPNGIHILQDRDRKCNGNVFIELVTSEDCARASNLHERARILDAVIRIMPVKIQEMKKELSENKARIYGPPPPGPLPPMPMPRPPMHPDIGLRMPPGAPPPPVMFNPPVLPPPIHLSERELAIIRHSEGPPMAGPRPIEFRDPPRPPIPPLPPGMPGNRIRGRSPTPPHMKLHRPTSPRMLPPMRPHSPPPDMRSISPSMGLRHRSHSPPMRPRSPRDMMRIQEMQRRADAEELHRRIEHERILMRDRMHSPGFRRGPFDDHPRFPIDMDLPRYGMDMSGFRMDGPRFEGPLPPHFPMDMPRFPMPEPVPIKMSNLSFHITQEDIIEFFIKFSPIPRSVRLMYNNTGKLTGEGFVAFPGREAAEAAVKNLHQVSLLNRKIRLELA